MTKRHVLAMVTVALAVTLMSFSAGAVPEGINYQGRLTDSSGAPLHGMYPMHFYLYCQDAIIWQQQYPVVVTDGIFNIMLGLGDNPMTPDLFQCEELYLEVHVWNADMSAFEMLEPRQRLISTPFALRAAKADDADTLDGLDAGIFLTAITPSEISGASSGSMLSVTNDGSGTGVYGKSIVKNGVFGETDAADHSGVFGTSTVGVGVMGFSNTNDAIVGKTDASGKSGVFGHSDYGTGVTGRSNASSGHGVHGHAEASGGVGVYAYSRYGKAIDAHTSPDSTDEWTPAIYGRNDGAGDGVYGWSQSRHGLVGISSSGAAAIWAKNNSTGPAILAEGGSDGLAGDFRGNVRVRSHSTGTTVLELGEGLDYAEGFNVSYTEKIDPGSVLVIDPDNGGKLTLSNSPYDTKVAGIVAGAKNLGSGVRLGIGQFDYDVALAGRVYCNVDATYSKVSPGDLLTTSDTPGYAMKVSDYTKAQGAILGKAMEKLPKGAKRQILVLVTLQ